MAELKSALATPPVALLAPCEAPADLPAGALSAGKVELLWAHDRSALAVCSLIHDAVVDFYGKRDKGLAGG